MGPRKNFANNYRLVLGEGGQWLSTPVTAVLQDEECGYPSFGGRWLVRVFTLSVSTNTIKNLLR